MQKQFRVWQIAPDRPAERCSSREFRPLSSRASRQSSTAPRGWPAVLAHDSCSVRSMHAPFPSNHPSNGLCSDHVDEKICERLQQPRSIGAPSDGKCGMPLNPLPLCRRVATRISQRVLRAVIRAPSAFTVSGTPFRIAACWNPILLGRPPAATASCDRICNLTQGNLCILSATRLSPDPRLFFATPNQSGQRAEE